MQRSTERILSTHVGSLARPHDLLEVMREKEHGRPYDHARFTEMIAGAPLEEMLKAVPMRRLGTPEEVAATVAFLMSDEAGYVTRQVIGVNGGIV